MFRVARSTLLYESVQTAKDAPLLARLRALSARHPRYGYRFMRALLAQEGTIMSTDKCYRLWRLARLQVPHKRRRRRRGLATSGLQPATRPHQTWAMDFVHDTCANGHALKCLTLVDEHTREALAIDVGGSFRARAVVDTLTRVANQHGTPTALRCDNGPEFISRAVVQWATQHGVTHAFIDPGSPWQNGIDERFNGTLRNECLNAEWFRNRVEAAVVIEQFRVTYNTQRPHSALGYLTPAAFRRKYEEQSQPQIF
jgi:putative transposase